MSIAITLHLLSVVVWVGGMFFAYMVLRPVAAKQLEPPQRLTLWSSIFDLFFPWVWLALLLILGSGLWIIFNVYSGFANLPLTVHIMFALGLVMMLIFIYVYVVPRSRLKAAVQAQNWPAGGQALAQIRRLVGLNTLLGLLTTAVAVGGKFWF